MMRRVTLELMDEDEAIYINKDHGDKKQNEK